MNNQIQIFNNPQFGEIRTTLNENKEPIFCAKDVATALGYADTADAVSRHCKSGKKVFHPHPNSVGGINMVYITEKDVYRLIMRSNLPDAEKFQDWVCDEVLPSIRKTGGYMATKADDTPEEIMARAIVIANDTIARQKQRIAEQSEAIAQKDKAIGRLKPKADFVDTVFASDTLVSIGQAAKILKLPFGRNTLFKKLREKGVFFKNTNEPKQRFVDAKYFNLVEGQPIPRSDGSIFIPITVYCTQKGLAYINYLFGNSRINPQLAHIV